MSELFWWPEGDTHAVLKSIVVMQSLIIVRDNIQSDICCLSSGVSLLKRVYVVFMHEEF